jgi:SAM-dependent methyltransferase
MTMFRDWISESYAGHAATGKGKPLHVAVFGSALGLDVRDALLRLPGLRLPDRRPDSIALTLMDVDPAALDFARQQLAGLLLPEKLTCVSANLFRLPQRPNLAQPLAGADLLFCPGLFDYLEDDAVAAMLQLLWRQLAPGGRLIVFQFAPHNPSRALMEWIGNWYLIYRDQSQLQLLAAAAGLAADCVTLGAEPQGVDLYLRAAR